MIKPLFKHSILHSAIILLIVSVRIIDASGNLQYQYHKNMISLEILGNAIPYSINYERIIIYPFSMRVGYMFIPYDVSKVMSTPILLNYLYKINSHSLEVGIGPVFSYAYHTMFENHNQFRTFLSFSFAYRFEPDKSRFIFRAGFTPYLYKNSDYINSKWESHGPIKFKPWPALSIGYKF